MLTGKLLVSLLGTEELWKETRVEAWGVSGTTVDKQEVQTAHSHQWRKVPKEAGRGLFQCGVGVCGKGKQLAEQAEGG